MPVFGGLFFLATASNIGVPLSFNWLGEFMALAGAYANTPVVGLIGSSGILLSACYSVWLFNRVIGGGYSRYLGPMIDITRREWHVMFPLIGGTLVLGIVPNVMLSDIHVAVSQILIQ